MLREKFAWVKVFVDFITGIQPKFLGEKIKDMSVMVVGSVITGVVGGSCLGY